MFVGCFGFFFVLHTLFAANKLRKEIYSPEWRARSARRPRQDCAAQLCGDSAGTGNARSEQHHLLSVPLCFKGRVSKQVAGVSFHFAFGVVFILFSWSVSLLSAYKVIY